MSNMSKLKISSVSVKDTNKELVIPLNERGNLSMNLLVHYFPHATGLATLHEGKSFVVDVDHNNKEYIIDTIFKGNIFHVHETETKVNSFGLSFEKAKRVKQIIDQIRGGPNTSSNLKQIPNVKMNEKKINKRERVVQVGWLHKSQNKFKQIRRPFGGTRQLKLNTDEKYFIDDFISKVKNVYFGDQSSSDFPFDINSVTTMLGNFDGTLIDFASTTGEPCDLWTYCKSHGIIPYRNVFYLLTTTIVNVENNGEEDSSIDLGDTINNELVDHIEVYYHDIKVSKYTEALTICEKNKRDLYDTSLDIEQQQNVTFEEFDPHSYGFQISKIVKNDKVLLQICIENESGSDKAIGSKHFSFPSAPEEVLKSKHVLLHDSDEVHGICDGRFGAGAIINCTESCHAMFNWYNNKKLIKKGEFLYWIEVPNFNTLLAVSCVVECNSKDHLPHEDNDEENVFDTTKSSVLELNSEQGVLACINKTGNTVASIPIIDKTNIIFSKIVIGVGAQGKVRQGSWLGTTVAVNTIRTLNSNVKLASREIEILGSIRHPNIIQVMAICMEPKQLHIVMELMNGSNLSDILFDDQVKEEYNLNLSNKHSIGNQICLGVNYLHGQQNQIIHGDIKPENILVNNQLLVKLCDLGLSRFKNTVTSLRSTVGTGTLKGTPIYMAPEIILNNSEPSIYSDLWAVGCTLFEMYSEESIWIMKNGNYNELKEKMIKKEVPNIENVPGVKELVRGCFDYDPLKRPTIFDILNKYATLTN